MPSQAMASAHALATFLARSVRLKKATALPICVVYLVLGLVSLPQKLNTATSLSKSGQLPGLKRVGYWWNSRSTSM